MADLAGRRGVICRRSVLAGTGAMALTALTGRPAQSGALELVARQRPRSLLLDAHAIPTLGYAEDAVIPVFRTRVGEPFAATLVNQLDEHSSIHWHGIRLENAMDGVPYLTQPPVAAGGRFAYEFVPPDAGTFFFHPHCDTVNQLGRGLVGVLIVEHPDDGPFAADLVCAYKDWLLDVDGSFGALTTDRAAGRAGTFGNLRTVNGVAEPETSVPAGGWIRVRVLNLDNTRILEVGIEGASGWIIATDGNALPEPLALDTWQLAPAMRIDVAFRAPAAGADPVRLVNYFGAEPAIMARYRSARASLDGDPARPPKLAPSNVPVPSPKVGEAPLRFTFSAGTGGSADVPPDLQLPDGSKVRYADALCLVSRTFWAINKTPWPPEMTASLPPPLMSLERGRSYEAELVNVTPQLHPIHVHGHTFTVLGSSKRQLPKHQADSVLLHPNERVRVAFVADNPGDWMLHCHIIEHQDTGMMGYIRVA